MTYLKWICVGISDGLSRGNGGPGIFFTMFNVVVLITLRHCTFNGWMDWGSIKWVNIKKSNMTYLK